ncbi:MAG: PspC domain-containing protein [Crocinitomicaceae bacterium]|nr:PspC domain-containing protein [Crocinitomicaceae bacterium]
MKKTVSVNIKGINFLIEEDAYELLQDYLDRLTQTLNNVEGSKEIVEDVELRIAELCSSKLNDSKTVIELNDIDSIIAALGNPEDYLEEDEEQSTKSTNNHTSSKSSEKRLFRDTENATIAGVCMGIANFFNIDVVIVRAIFVVISIFAGFGFPLYIILWLIVPKAQNTIDRLRMKGRPITVESVREEVEIAAGKIKEGGKNMAHRIRKDGTYQKSMSRGVKIIRTILGVGFIGVGIAILIPFLIFVIGGAQIIPVQSADGFLSLSELGEIALNNQSDFNMAWWGVMIAGFSMALFFFLIGIIFIFSLKNKWAKLSLLGLFLSGVTGGIMCAVVGIRTGRDLAIGAELESEFGSVATKELTIIPNIETITAKGNYDVKSNGDWGLMGIDKESITLHGIHLRYVRSKDSLFHIQKNIKARSHSHKQGITKCQNIQHDMSLQRDTLHVDSEYTFPKTDKLRDQEIYLTIEIPKGGLVHIDDRIVQLDEVDYKEEESTYYIERGMIRGNGSYRKRTHRRHW